MNNLTREQKLYGVAGAHALFALGLFLTWIKVDTGIGSAKASGFDSLPSGWLWLVLALTVAAIFGAEAAGFELPTPLLNFQTAAAGSFAIVFMMAAMLFEAENLSYGFWISLIGAVVGFAGTILAVRDRL